jgi:RNA polymerase sigma-70 factor (ECF subfamily)
MVELRIDPRLRSRLDASDILQEAYLDLSRDFPSYLASPELRPFLWMRLHVGRNLAIAHRRHLGARMRDAGLEISLYHHQEYPGASSVGLAHMLLGRDTSPSQAAQRAERLAMVQKALNDLEPIDREILALRHFEHLSRSEAAAILGIDPTTGAKRYYRALLRLREILTTIPDGLEEP